MRTIYIFVRVRPCEQKRKQKKKPNGGALRFNDESAVLRVITPPNNPGRQRTRGESHQATSLHQLFSSLRVVCNLCAVSSLREDYTT